MTIKYLKLLILYLSVAVLALSACSGISPSPTPTEVNFDAIYTAAAATIYAGQTSTAIARPTNTLTPTATITQTATITPTVQPTQAVYYPPVQPIVFATLTPGTPLPTGTATLGAVGCYNSAFIQDVTIPPDTKIPAGDGFTKTWRIKNTGTCGWVEAFKFTFIGGNVMGSDTTKIRRKVGAGFTTDISLNMVAPLSPGTYTGYWRMADDTGKLFGTSFSVVIIVPGPTFTPTTEPSATIFPTPEPSASVTP